MWGKTTSENFITPCHHHNYDYIFPKVLRSNFLKENDYKKGDLEYISIINVLIHEIDNCLTCKRLRRSTTFIYIQSSIRSLGRPYYSMVLIVVIGHMVHQLTTN